MVYPVRGKLLNARKNCSAACEKEIFLPGSLRQQHRISWARKSDSAANDYSSIRRETASIIEGWNFFTEGKFTVYPDADSTWEDELSTEAVGVERLEVWRWKREAGGLEVWKLGVEVMDHSKKGRPNYWLDFQKALLNIKIWLNFCFSRNAAFRTRWIKIN